MIGAKLIICYLNNTKKYINVLYSDLADMQNSIAELSKKPGISSVVLNDYSTFALEDKWQNSNFFWNIFFLKSFVFVLNRFEWIVILRFLERSILELIAVIRSIWKMAINYEENTSVYCKFSNSAYLFMKRY